MSDGSTAGAPSRLMLTIPNRPDYLALVQHTTRDAARLAGFHKGGRHRASNVVCQLAQVFMGTPARPLEDGEIDLTCEVVPGGLSVTLHDDGPPFDPSLRGQASAFVHGLLTDGSPDWVEFRNLGRGGTTVQVMLHVGSATTDAATDLPQESDEDDAFVVTASPEATEPAGEAAPALTPDTPPRPAAGPAGAAAPASVDEVEVTYELFRPEQAAAVSSCIYDAYRLTYLHEDMYHPLRIAALNQSGDMISAVATVPDGTVVGHFALSFADDRSVPELGIAATRRDWRGRHIAHRLADLLMQEGQRRGLYGTFAEAITVHPYTQHLNVALGLGTCGVRLASIPPDREFRGIDEHPRHRNSAMTMFRYFVEPSRVPLDVPPRHRDMIARLYGWIGAPDRLDGSPPGGLDAVRERPAETAIEVRLTPASSIAGFTVTSFGDDARTRLHDELRMLRESEFRVVEAALDMTKPGAAAAAAQLEELGFLFVGVRPGGPGVEWLLMQYFNGVIVDYEVMAVDSEESHELVEYVRALDPDAD